MHRITFQSNARYRGGTLDGEDRSGRIEGEGKGDPWASHDSSTCAGERESTGTARLDGPGRGMDRSGVPSQRRFHASAVLSLLRCPAQPDEGLTVKQEIKAIDERDDPQRREPSSAAWRIRRSHATVGGGPSGARLAQGRASSPLVGAFSACPRRRVDEGRDRSCSMKGHNLLLVKVALGREEAQPGHAPALLLSGCCHWLLAASSASSLESPASYSMMAARSS